MVDNPVKFHEYIDSRELQLPCSTTQFEQDGKVGGDRGVAYTLVETLYLIFLLGFFGSLFDIQAAHSTCSYNCDHLTIWVCYDY